MRVRGCDQCCWPMMFWVNLTLNAADVWAAIDHESQIIATGTALPEAELGSWQVFMVTAGEFNESTTTMEETE